MITNSISSAIQTSIACIVAVCFCISESNGQQSANLIAVDRLTNKADSGSVPSMVLLGEFHRDSVRPDFDKALHWFREAHARGSTIAMDRIGGMYLEGHGVKKDYTVALDWYTKAVEAGDSTAMASVGWMHFHGLGVKKDFSEALHWYQLAAEKGGHEGMNNMGHMYLKGIGVKQDTQQALRWFKKSSDAGNSHAYDNIGVLYLEGNGVEKSIESAKEMFKMAAKLGLTDSMIRLGRLERVNGSPNAQKAAFNWFAQANSSAEGMRELGECYFDGIGVEPSVDEGF
jgi:TPR repeat protein